MVTPVGTIGSVVSARVQMKKFYDWIGAVRRVRLYTKQDVFLEEKHNDKT
jgi:hypothetical protein